MADNRYTDQLRKLKTAFGFEFVSLAVALEAGQQLLTWIHATGNRNARYRRIVLEPGKGIAGEVYHGGNAMVIQDANEEISEQDRFKYPITIAEELRSILAFPLWKEDKVGGILLLAFRSPNKISRELFQNVLDSITPAFCDFQVKEVTFEAAGHAGDCAYIQPVPVYELLNYHIIRAHEEERRRISRELHDSIMQQLVGIQMLIRTVKYQPSREKAMEALEQIDLRMVDIQNDLRSISTSLRPTVLDDLGLSASYRVHFDRVQATYDVRVHFHDRTSGCRYTPDQETVFFRVCQEAVTNACKYSGCNEIEVFLVETEGYLTLKVKDTGVGFDPEHIQAKGSGMGLLSMADRAELIDGELTYQTAPGKGTTIWLTAPILRKDHT